MRVRTIPRRLPEIGRLRLGEERASGQRPGKPLDRYRVTSSSREVVDAVQAIYGGTVRPWASPDGPAWQLVVDAPALQVIVPPEHAYSSAYEQWAAGGCQVRCDGVTATTVERGPDGPYQAVVPCVCAASGQRECALVSRINLILQGVQVVGVWRLETRSYYAALELPAVVDLAAALSRYGGYAPATLAIEERVRRSPVGGMRRYRVPVLRLGPGVSDAFERFLAAPEALPAPVTEEEVF